ncbi:MAG: alpha-galactosidase [Lentisphaerota bacterium]
MSSILTLSGKTSSIVFKASNETIPSVIYWGDRLNCNLSEGDIVTTQDLPVPQAFLDEVVEISLLPEEGQGFFGNPGLIGNADGHSWTTQFKLEETIKNDHSVKFICVDSVAKLRASIELTLDYESDILQKKIVLANLGDKDYSLQNLSLSLPVPSFINELMVFRGRWTQEFKTERIDWHEGTYARETRKGRTSNDNIPYLIAGRKGFSEETGTVYGFHLGWSGNSGYKASVLNDGRRIVQFSELLLSGEISLKKNEVYETPIMYAVYSSSGLNGISQGFHSFLRKSDTFINHKRDNRPVHFNTWEAVYFTHKKEKLFELVDKSAELGIERFILDDGWFRGRDGERAGLGDWFVDERKYPEGLGELVKYVNSKGMEFGLWFEPEMINPDSDLFRNHPEWMLKVDEYKQRLGRYQYVINLSNEDAYNYIYQRLDSLLSQYNIGYIKWDMNRDLSQPGDSDGKPSVHNQVKHLYRLLGSIEEKHPNVEIESCSSGGARADLGILKYTNRVWASDCNDPHERQIIQRGFSYFLPPEIMGSHFGPSPAHTTGRMASLKFRILTSLFGHLGFEQDVSTLTNYERIELKGYVALYKKLRPLIHTGSLYRLDTSDRNLLAFAVTSEDKNESILSIAQLAMPEFMLPEKLYLKFLDPDKKYEVDVIDRITPTAGIMKKEPDWLNERILVNGECLAKLGLQLPVMYPDSILLIRFKSV